MVKKKTSKIFFCILVVLLLPSFLICPNTVSAQDNETENEAAQLNQLGINAIVKNDYRQAIDYFERALSMLPGQKTIKNNLAVAYNNYGIALSNEKRYEDAKENLYRAIELDSGNNSYKENLTNIISTMASNYYMNGSYEVAQMELKQSLSLSPKHVPSLVLLGQTYYQTQDLEKAQEIWTKALSLDPGNKELQSLLSKVKKENLIETPLKQLDSSYFDIRFDKKAIESDIYDVRMYLQDAYRDVGRDLNYYPDYKIPVIIYTQEDFRSLRQTPQWVAGLYDGKIRLPLKNGGIPEQEFKCLLWHEYTHAVIFSLSNGNCPIWFNEGIAKFEEAKVAPPDLSLFINAVKNKSLLPFSQLSSYFSMNAKPEQVALAYLEAYIFVEFVMDRWNYRVIRDVLEYIKHGKSFDDAFYEITNRTPEKLHDEWIEYIKRKYCA